LLLVVAWLLGAAAGPAVFCLCWLHWHAGERWPPSLAIGAVLGLALWLLFSVLPGVPLYPGAMLRLPG
jgi:hypothetical protein